MFVLKPSSFWFGLALVLLALIPFAPVWDGTPIWEDQKLIDTAAGPWTDSFRKPFLGSYFRPLVSLSFWIDRRLGGTVPFQYHQTNSLLHAASVLLLWQAMRPWLANERAAWLSAIFLALQPAQVAAVAWIGGRTDSLAVFWMTLLLAWGGWARQGKFSPVVGALGASVIAAAGLLTKEQTGALLPFWLWGAHAIVGAPKEGDARGDHGGRGGGGQALAWIWSAGLLAAALLFGLLWKSAAVPSPPIVWRGWTETFDLSVRTIGVYFLLLAAPFHGPMHWTTTLPLGLAPAIVVLALVVGCAAAWTARPGGEGRKVVPWMLWIALALAPVSNAVPLSSLVLAPYRASLAGVGAAVLVGILADRSLGWGIRGRLMVGALLVWHGSLCVWGAGRWSGPDTVLRTFSRADPGSFFVLEGMSSHHLSQGKPDRARDSIVAFLRKLLGTNAITDAESIVGRLEADQALLRRIRDGNGEKRAPRAAMAHLYVLLGNAALESGSMAEAGDALRVALALVPDDSGAHFAMARWCDRQGQWLEGLLHIDQVIAVKPDVPSVHAVRARLLEQLGRWADAARSWENEAGLTPWVVGHWERASQAWSKAGIHVKAEQAKERQGRLRKRGMSIEGRNFAVPRD